MRLAKYTSRLWKLPFSSIRRRLMVFLLLLLLPVLAGIYWFVSQENQRYTDQTINSYLGIGAEVFEFSRAEHINTLLTVSSALTRDWGFRNAFGAADRATVLDAARNLLMRSFDAADMMLIADMNGQVIADTAEQGYTQLAGSWLALMQQAAGSNEGVAEAVLSIHGKPYQVTVIPLFLPAPVAWIFAGFPLNENFVRRIKSSTASDVSVLRYAGGDAAGSQGSVVASTLSEADANMTLLQLDPRQTTGTQRLSLPSSDYGAQVRQLTPEADQNELIVAVIQRSYLENENNLRQLQDRLFLFSVIIVCLSLVAAVILARSFTRPVLALANRVKMIQQGAYEASAAIPARTVNDELAELDSSLTDMARGLAERENMRDLLGKVVSPQIAAELLGSRIELGGEERVVTVLFADIRGFTSLSEQQTPSETLYMLNLCFEQLCHAIEQNGGVVDKFTGDAVMALFGAPVTHEDDAVRAARTVIAIQAAVGRLNQDPRIPSQGLSVGLGLHTGLVVAGNMGSTNRMNYTVIGDAVNLSARLESLTRLYGVPNLVSDGFIAALGVHASDFALLELDRVRVKGRRETSRLYTITGTGAGGKNNLQKFDRMLTFYRSGRWDDALDILAELELIHHAGNAHGLPIALYRMYRRRIQALRADPPAAWDGVFDLSEK